MPEGPEVKRCGELMSQFIAGKELSLIVPVSGKLFRTPPSGLFDLCTNLLPQRVEAVRTYGKSIFIEVGENITLLSTLGMSGWWYPSMNQISKVDLDRTVYHSGRPHRLGDVVEASYKHVRLELIYGEHKLLFTDPRNFGNFKIIPRVEALKRQVSLGIDLLSRKIEDGEWITRLREVDQDRKIGEVLIDQGVIAGFGNIYRAETLYIAKISPHRKLKDLSPDEILLLKDVGALVLYTGYFYGGAVKYRMRNLAEANREWSKAYWAFEPEFCHNGHLVYGRETDMFEQPVVTEEVGGRTMHWVPKAQN